MNSLREAMLFEHVVDFLVEQRLFELSDAVARKLRLWMSKNELPFDNLFPGGKLRIVIPLEDDEIASSILKKIEQAGLKIDFDQGVVSDGRRKIRIGKFILGKKSPFTKEEKEWFIDQGEAIEALRDASRLLDKYAVVISRSPLDVVRMSDHEGRWTSCHSEGRRYFHCAVSEARYGGPIAYLVNKKDLEGVNLQKPEIFMDSDRGISGIVPLARVRLRRFTNVHKEYDLAVPETRIYGKSVPGFIETVRRWALESQRSVIGDERPDMKEFVRRGGHYRDADFEDGDWFNKLFGDSASKGDVEYNWEDEDIEYIERWATDKCEGIYVEYLQDLKFVEVTWEVTDDYKVLWNFDVLASIKAEVLKPIDSLSSEEVDRVKKKILQLCEELGIGVFDVEIVSRGAGEVGVKGHLPKQKGTVVEFEESAGYAEAVIEPLHRRFVDGCKLILGREGIVRIGESAFEKVIESWNKGRFDNFDWRDVGDPSFRGVVGNLELSWSRERYSEGRYCVGELPEFPVDESFGDEGGKLPPSVPGLSDLTYYVVSKLHYIGSGKVAGIEFKRDGSKFVIYKEGLEIHPNLTFHIDANKDVHLLLGMTIDFNDEESQVSDVVNFVDEVDRNFDYFINYASRLFSPIVAGKHNS